MPEPAPPTADPAPPPPMVLLDRCVGFIDELREFIKETGGLPLDRSIDLALKRLPASNRRREKFLGEKKTRNPIIMFIGDDRFV
ncbi:unnamed protein product [Urochloa humidicola]